MDSMIASNVEGVEFISIKGFLDACIGVKFPCCFQVPRSLLRGSSFLARIEARIRYDLEFENYDVVIERLGSINSPCSQEFLWRLDIIENEPG